MLDNWPLLSLIIFSPLLGVLVLAFLPKHNGRLIKIVGIAATVLPLLFSLFLFAGYDRESANSVQYTEEARWIAVDLQRDQSELEQLGSLKLVFNYKVGADGLSVAMITLTAVVALMAALASVHIKKRWKLYFILFLLLETGMLGVFAARDLFLFFVFFEVTLVTTFFLIGIWGFKHREKAANKFLIYNGIGSAFMLIGFLLLVVTAGFSLAIDGDANLPAGTYSADLDVIAANLNDSGSFANLITRDNPFQLTGGLAWFAFIMVLLAFAIKLPVFPFHTWMLKVHGEAPPAVVMIHSGILLKMGGYGLVRFGAGLFPEQIRDFAFVLALFGVINILYGALIAFRQTDIRLVLAYSSVSHMGIVLLGIAALNNAGLQGALFQMVSHGLISALLFLIVGSLYERTGTFETKELGGLAKTAPFMCGVLLAGGMASLGLPGLSGFVSEFMAFVGLFDTMPVMTAIGVLGIILTAAYVLRAFLRMTYGPMPERFEGVKDARLVEAFPMAVLLALIVLIGVYPAILSESLQQSVDVIVQNIAGKIGG
jgi:NADH-quinone oxidoreductase subunit M